MGVRLATTTAMLEVAQRASGAAYELDQEVAARRGFTAAAASSAEVSVA